MMKPEVSQPTKECPQPQLWRCYDLMTAEVEVLEFLQGLIRAVKPKLVVETGSYRGLAANYIGLALKQAGRGKLITCEIDEKMYAHTLQQCAGVLDVVECRRCSSLDMTVEGEIDILFSDSEPNLRIAEIEHFWKQLTPASLILVHDVNSGAHLPLRKCVLQLDRVHALSVIILPTPRGLALCQKTQGR